MRLRVLVDDHGSWRDLLVSVGAGHSVADLTRAIATHLERDDVSGLRRGLVPGAPLDLTTAVGDSGLRWGDRLTLITPSDPSVIIPDVPLRRLVVTAGPDAGRALPLHPGRHQVGRADEAGLRIDDPHMSRAHLGVEVEAAGVHVVDLGSSNGTLLDGDVVGATPVELRTGNTVIAGASLLRLRPPPPRQQELPARDGTVAFTRRPRVEPALPERTVRLHDDEADDGRGLLRGLLRRGSRTGPTELTVVDQRREIARLRALHPDPLALVERACFLRPELWERRPDDEDFLHLRVGWQTDDGGLGIPVPAVLDLREVGSLAVCCTDDRLRRRVLRWLAVQLAGLCSPTELRLVVAGEAPDWSWSTWLPHTTTSDTTGTDHLQPVLAELGGGRRGAPALVLVGEADELDRDALQAILTAGPGAGVHALLGVTDRTSAPDVGVLFEVDPASGRGRWSGHGGRGDVEGVDGTRTRTALDLALGLSGIRDVTGGGFTSASLPPAVSLLELLDITDPHPRRITEWWATGDRPAAIGAVAGGPIALEVGRGAPHALVAASDVDTRVGMLRTAVAAACATRGPNRLQLVLVDGAADDVFGPCSDLPHVRHHAAGPDTVTDATAWLHGELDRRTQDADAPGMPQLLVVVEDAATLLDTHDDLVHVLEGAIGAGPELGVTLVLSTGRPEALPAGLRSQLQFRIAFHLEESTASEAVLGGPAATTLPVAATGRGYVRDAAGEVLSFQMARVDVATSARGGPETIEIRDVVAGRPVTERSTTTSVVPAPPQHDTDLVLLVAACAAASPASHLDIATSTTDEPSVVERTFFFSDVVRSTALVEAIGDEHWTRLVQWHDHAITELVDAHGGEVVDHTGDGFFVAFVDASAALRCSIEIQQMLRRHRMEAGFAPDVRIGLHHTDVRYDGRYRGRGVHIAARVAALADGGEVLASATTLERAPDIPVGPVRTAELRGVSTPVPVASVLVD